MNRATRTIVVVLGVATGTPAVVIAQDEQFAPIVLQLPASARATGIGGAFVAVRDIESILANPAFAGFTTGTAVSVERYPESRAGTITASMTLGQFGVAISTQYLDFAAPANVFPPSCSFCPIAVPSRVLSERGPNSAAASSLAATIGASTNYKGYRWGAGVKYAEAHLGSRRESAPAFDVGVAKEGSLFIVGLAVQNLGRDINDDAVVTELPARVTLGVSTLSRPLGAFDVSLSTAVSYLRDGFVSPAGGMEWGYSPLEGYSVVARIGARRPELKELRPLTFGASFTFDRLSIDYAFDDVRGGAGHRLGLRVR
jgi:hypothetical protein